MLKDIPLAHGLCLNQNRALVADQSRVPVSRNLVNVSGVTFAELEVDEVGRGSSLNRPLNVENFPRDYLRLHSNSGVLKSRNFISQVLLVLRVTKLVLSVEVDPQLEAEACLIKAGGHLSVYDSLASGHPLNITRADLASVTLEVFVLDLALKHVSHCLETPMRMVWEPSRQLHVKKVKHQEGIHIGQQSVSNNPAHCRSITFRLVLGFEVLSELLEF